MKRITIILSVICACATIVRAEIKWLETVYNFGTFDENMGKVSCEMRFVNIGDDDVVIEAVRPTCGCTAGNYPKNAIAPGDTASVTLTYNPFGRPGKFSKDVYVITNTSPRRTKLTVEGNVIGSANTVRSIYPYEVGDMKFNRVIIPFGEIKKSKVPMQVLKGYNRSIDTVVVDMPALPPFINAMVIPQKVGPGDLCTVSLYYDSNKQSGWGFLSDEFKVTSHNLTSGAVADTTIEVTAIISEDFSNLTKEQIAEAPTAVLSPNRINLEPLAPGKKVNASFSIRNDGKSPLIIRKIYWVDKALEVSPVTTTIAPGKSAIFKIKIDSKKITDEAFIAKIMILTNDPLNSSLSVRIAGELIK